VPRLSFLRPFQNPKYFFDASFDQSLIITVESVVSSPRRRCVYWLHNGANHEFFDFNRHV
jgi:hypothetical protein